MAKPTIDTAKIPASVGRELARVLLRDVALWFEVPENRAKFEEWQAKKNEREAEGTLCSVEM